MQTVKTSLKIMMLGEIAVGKTSISRKLVFDTFETSYKATIGVDIYSHDVKPVSSEGVEHEVNLLIWDVDGDLGQGIFNHIYMRGAHAGMIVCDATRPATHQTAVDLLASFERQLPGRPAYVMVNKLDMLSPGDPMPLPGLQNLGYETIGSSAKTGLHISSAFSSLASECVKRRLHL